MIWFKFNNSLQIMGREDIRSSIILYNKYKQNNTYRRNILEENNLITQV